MRIWWTVLLIACGDNALDRVKVCGDLVVPRDLVAVRVTVLDLALTERAAGVSDLASSQLPVVVSVPVVPGDRVIRAQALDVDGAEVARAEVLVSSGAGSIVLNLAQACLGQDCALGQTCVDGACVVTPDAAASKRCDVPTVIPDTDDTRDDGDDGEVSDEEVAP